MAATPTNVVCAPPAIEASTDFSQRAHAGKQSISSVPDCTSSPNMRTVRPPHSCACPAPSQSAAIRPS